MGMGGSMTCLNSTINTLNKTWQAWLDETDKVRKKKLEQNFEHLLSEVHAFLGYVNEEWRSAFIAPKKKLKYDEKLQHELVDKYVPKSERERVLNSSAQR